MKKSRAFCFTMNNPTMSLSDVESMLKAAGSKYYVVGSEGGEGRTPHFQGYVYFRSERTMQQAIAILIRCHVEMAVASASENRTYCLKEGGEWAEHGKLPVQGSRTELKEIFRRVTEDSQSVQDMVRTPWRVARYPRILIIIFCGA